MKFIAALFALLGIVYLALAVAFRRTVWVPPYNLYPPEDDDGIIFTS